MRLRGPLFVHAAVLVGYLAVALAFAWPLPRHVSTHLTGAPSGDTGVYVWNQWVFRHELVTHGRLPYFTDTIFATTGSPANLSLHNYTPFQDLVALPLITPLGVVASFNVVFLAMRLLTAYATFLLARRVTGRVAESWLAGLLFAWSPLLITRGTGHFSLVAAAPLAVFLLLILERGERRHWLSDIALGATIAWATSADAYYGVYCLLIGALFLVERLVSTARRAPSDASRRLGVALNALMPIGAALVAGVVITGGWSFTVAGVTVRMHSLYTPMLVLTGLVLARLALHRRVVLERVSWLNLREAGRATAVAGVTASVLLSPLLYAFAARRMNGRLSAEPVYWRSSAPGVDLLALVTPNPNHPLAPDWLRGWLMPQSDAYLESVVSLPLVGLAVLVGAWAYGWRPARWWAMLAGGFGLLALGPFVHIGGVNTFVPGPWAIVRYVPLAGMARTPGRFSIVLMLAFAVLATMALTWLGRRFPQRRYAMLAVTGVLLVAELLPAPRTLYSAEVPSLYAQIAADPGLGPVLHLPFGVRDGTSSAGDFNARTMYFQTAHGKPLIGGYLSRVSRQRLREVRSEHVLDSLITLSEGRTLPLEDEHRLRRDARAFARRVGIAYVVVNRDEFPAAAASLVYQSFALELVAADAHFSLYRPAPN
jgi:hypothetical protein